MSNQRYLMKTPQWSSPEVNTHHHEQHRWAASTGSVALKQKLGPKAYRVVIHALSPSVGKLPTWWNVSIQNRNEAVFRFLTWDDDRSNIIVVCPLLNVDYAGSVNYNDNVGIIVDGLADEFVAVTSKIKVQDIQNLFWPPIYKDEGSIDPRLSKEGRNCGLGTLCIVNVCNNRANLQQIDVSKMLENVAWNFVTSVPWMCQEAWWCTARNSRRFHHP